ncbi:unnamed protein product [Echinostoma caproni]|uniref:BRO1 domain-containing protein n=1 Tax=Echinostoma caproni TaxID=27848 RepID=A0A183BE09_9TREM|nr:unnamed protein product [Echinostoma caproni]
MEGLPRISVVSLPLKVPGDPPDLSPMAKSLDVGFEEAAILFNISSLHTILGAKERRIDADSMKVACTHFQCAAWALETFAERHYAAEASGDLNTDLIRALAQLMTVSLPLTG